MDYFIIAHTPGKFPVYMDHNCVVITYSDATTDVHSCHHTHSVTLLLTLLSTHDHWPQLHYTT
eukprot:scaffold171961_cov24-Prasinocladus_malaysianus.AAC.2